MNKAAIEREVRKVQYEVWSRRKLLWPMGEPPIEAMFDPMVIAPLLDLEYEIRDQMGAELGRGFEAAGVLDRSRGILAVSSRFNYPTQRFTAAHEIGHYVLHPWIGDRIAHRDRPIDGMQPGRSPVEREADYFAACLLMPMKPLEKAFRARFGSLRPLPQTETVAFNLHLDFGEVFSAPRGSLLFASAVARAQSFGIGHRFPSLAEHFGVSLSAMALRLQEAGLVADYLAS